MSRLNNKTNFKEKTTTTTTLLRFQSYLRQTCQRRLGRYCCLLLLLLLLLSLLLSCLKSQYKQLRVQGLVENNQVMILETPS